MTPALGVGATLRILHQQIAGTGYLGNCAKLSYSQHMPFGWLLLVGVRVPVNKASVGTATDMSVHTGLLG